MAIYSATYVRLLRATKDVGLPLAVAGGVGFLGWTTELASDPQTPEPETFQMVSVSSATGVFSGPQLAQDFITGHIISVPPASAQGITFKVR